MEYIVTIFEDGNKRKVISRHTDLNEAMEAGKRTYEKLNCMVSLISGNIDDDGKTEGKYILYKSWF